MIYKYMYCNNLKFVTFGSGLITIGGSSSSWSNDYAFSGTSIVKAFWLGNTPPAGYNYISAKVNYVANDQYTSLSNKTVYSFLSSIFEVDGVKYVPVSPSERTCDAIDCSYNESTENIHIGSTVTNQGISLTVKQVCPYTFYGNTYIKNVELDLSGNINEYTFADCSNMETVTLGEQITALGNSAFRGCSKLQSIIIPDSVKTIESYAFSGCSAISEIEIPQSVKKIGDYVFQGCSSLTQVVMADEASELQLGSNGSDPLFADCPLSSVYIGRNISYSTSSYSGYSPFYRNTSLRSVTITDEETEIGDNEFYGCTNLKKVTIGNGVASIGNWAFSGCSSLDNFEFGSAVETIGREAFSDCTAMTKLISHAVTPPVCGSQALDDINKWACTLYVSEGCTPAYQQADQWKEFFFINDDIAASIPTNTINDDTEEVRVYTIDGMGRTMKKGDLQSLPSGIYIVNGKKVAIR